MKNIDKLTLEDMKFKMKAWRTIAIIALLASVLLASLFIASEFELDYARRRAIAIEKGAMDFYCEKGSGWITNYGN